jgi:hypothetical protein
MNSSKRCIAKMKAMAVKGFVASMEVNERRY